MDLGPGGGKREMCARTGCGTPSGCTCDPGAIPALDSGARAGSSGGASGSMGCRANGRGSTGNRRSKDGGATGACAIMGRPLWVPAVTGTGRRLLRARINSAAVTVAIGGPAVTTRGAVC